MRLIDADELRKHAVKVCFHNAPECGKFDAIVVYEIDIMPTIDPESLRPTAEWIEAPDEGADGSWEACFAVHGNPDGQHHSTNIARIVARGALNEISHNHL